MGVFAPLGQSYSLLVMIERDDAGVLHDMKAVDNLASLLASGASDVGGVVDATNHPISELTEIRHAVEAWMLPEHGVCLSQGGLSLRIVMTKCLMHVIPFARSFRSKHFG